MLRSVRAGGLAAAAFVTAMFGAAAPAQAEVAEAPAASVVLGDPLVVPAPVIAPTPIMLAIPVVAEVSAPAADPAAEASLEELAAAHAASKVRNADHECLATAVYFEARGESLEGQLAVAEVVLNRAASGRFPANVCAVVKQPAQFSFVEDGRLPQADRSSAEWRRAVAIATIAQDELAAELPENVLFYHASYVAPAWGKRLTREARIGTHVFYS